MSVEYLGAAAESRPEMTFWTVGTFAMLYFGDPWYTYLPLLLLFSLTGGISYILIRKIRMSHKESNQNKISATQRELTGFRRKKKSNKSRSKVALDLVNEMLPNSTLAKAILGLGVFVNFGAGLLLWYRLWEYLSKTPEPGIIYLGLFLLPFLSIGMILAAYTWNA